MSERKIIKTKLGLVVGRFQPLHDGHKYLITMAIKENDLVVICIGSAQKADPLPLDERLRRLNVFLRSVECKNKKIKVAYLPDIESDERWPLYLKNGTGVTDETMNTFYTGDDLPRDYLLAMEELGFAIKAVERSSFNYIAPDGEIHKLKCATQIREIHKRLHAGAI